MKSTKTNEYYIAEEFLNLTDDEFIQVIDCIISDIRADILINAFDYSFYKQWEETIERAWKNAKRWDELSKEEKLKWLEED